MTKNKRLLISKIKELYPNEWVLLGNPVFDDTNQLDILYGVPIAHSPDKKELCYLGRSKTDGYAKITFIYTGLLENSRKITGIFKKSQTLEIK